MATATQDEIDAIVREVMAQLSLGVPPAAVKTVQPTLTPPTAAPSPIPRPNENERFIDARVVTLETIKGRLNGAARLVVAAGALVTPSVRDELRRRGVTLVQENHGVTRPKKKTSVLLVAGRTRRDPSVVVEKLRSDGLDVRSESAECMIEATKKVVAAIAGGMLGVLWTRHTAIGLCLANRYAGVRAVLAAGVPGTAASVAAVGANLLVLDPAAGTEYEKKQILREFCRGGIRECPEDLKTALDNRT